MSPQMISSACRTWDLKTRKDATSSLKPLSGGGSNLTRLKRRYRSDRVRTNHQPGNDAGVAVREVNHIRIKVDEGRNRIGSAILVLMIERRDDRSVCPRLNIFFKEGRATNNKPNPLCVVAELLELQIRHSIARLRINQRQKICSNLVGQNYS